MQTALDRDFTSLWCDLIFEELYRQGLRHVCIAPGSRSAPLTLAAVRHAELKTHSHYDERGLAFYALGLARALREPVVVVTTSGTAVANLYPALLEARESGVPLLVLTADRPAELMGCGANQTLNVAKVFSECPEFYQVLPVPEPVLPARWLLSVIDEAVSQVKRTQRVVHLNQCLREPLYGEGDSQDWNSWLEPVKHWVETTEPLCHWAISGFGETPLPAIDARKVVLVAGQVRPGEGERLVALAEQNNWLLIADIQSGLHGHPRALASHDLMLASEEFVQQLDQTTLVIQCGRRFISKRLEQWLGRRVAGNSACEHWYVDDSDDRQDPQFTVTRRIVSSTADFCTRIQAAVRQAGDQQWIEQLRQRAEHFARQVHDYIEAGDQLTETWAVSYTGRVLENQNLMIGNSMPVRMFDSLTAHPIQAAVHTNRGLSGIDGLLATSAGISASGKRCVLVVGDLSFLHDLNSLALIRREKVIIVLLNNDGGSIFNLFPVKDEQVLENYFRVQHGLTGKGAAEMFAIPYRQPQTRGQFEDDLQTALATGDAAMIEVMVPPDQCTDQFRELLGMARAFRHAESL